MTRNWRYDYRLCAVPLLLFLVLCIIKSVYNGFSDYAAYYYGSKELLRGNFLQVYDTDAFNSLIAGNYGLQNTFVSFTPFPPVTSLFLSPFLWMDLAVSKVVFNVLGAAGFTWSLSRLLQHLDRPAWLLLIVPVVFLIPLLNNVLFGQGYLFLFIFLTQGYLAYAGGKKTATALWWGAAIMFKLFPALIIVFLLIRKEYKLVATTIAVCGVLLLASIGLNSWGAWELYLFDIFPRLGNGELNSSYTPVFQSMFMLLKNLFIPDAMQNPAPAIDSPVLFAIMLTIFQAVLVFILLNAARKKAPVFQGFALWIFASLLLSPNGSSYSMVLLLFPLVSVVGSDSNFKRTFVIGAITLACCNLPVQPFIELDQLLLKFPRLWLMLALFVLVVGIMRARMDYRWALPCLLLFALVNARRAFPVKDNSQYLLASTPAIISSYSFYNDSLLIDYWSTEGKKRKFAGMLLRPGDSAVIVSNGQLYLNGRQLTNTPDWKKQPVLVDRSVIYLSDMNRGVGFYTLRKLNLEDLTSYPGTPGTSR